VKLPFLTLWESYRLRVSENRVLRKIYGLTRGEVADGCRRLHIEKLHNLYSSPNFVRVISKNNEISRV
jgi:hypothetical protein